jgi:hypothetical protein
MRNSEFGIRNGGQVAAPVRLLCAAPSNTTVFSVCGPGCADPQIAKSAKKLPRRWVVWRKSVVSIQLYHFWVFVDGRIIGREVRLKFCARAVFLDCVAGCGPGCFLCGRPAFGDRARADARRRCAANRSRFFPPWATDCGAPGKRGKKSGARAGRVSRKSYGTYVLRNSGSWFGRGILNLAMSAVVGEQLVVWTKKAHGVRRLRTGLSRLK